jgi:predicted DNA-binding transcriptional regulator AlpA
MSEDIVFLKAKEVQAMIRVGNTAFYELVKAGMFPEATTLPTALPNASDHHRIKVWVKSDVQNWMKKQTSPRIEK